MTPEITQEQKLTAFRFQLFLLSCQVPKMYWDKPEEAEFMQARTITGTTLEKTNWSVATPQLKERCPTVYNLAIENARRTLGILSGGKAITTPTN